MAPAATGPGQLALSIGVSDPPALQCFIIQLMAMMARLLLAELLLAELLLASRGASASARPLPTLYWEDHAGHDVSRCTGVDCGALPMATAAECQEACLSHPSCVGFVHMPLISQLHGRWINGHKQPQGVNYSCAAANTSGAPGTSDQALCWLKEWWGAATEDPDSQHWDPVGNRTSGCPFEVPCTAGQHGCRLSALIRPNPPVPPRTPPASCTVSVSVNAAAAAGGAAGGGGWPISKNSMGCHFDSGYAHQPQLLHSQMLWGGSFEFGAWPNTRLEPAGRVSSLDAKVTLGPPMVAAISGKAGSMQVTLGKQSPPQMLPRGTAAPFAGWANRGLGNAGLKIEAGKLYEGYFFARSDTEFNVSIRLEDYNMVNTNSTPTILAQQTFESAAANNTWTKFEFNFTASAATTCRAISPDAWGTSVEPCLAAVTEAETLRQRWGGAHICMQCGGQLSLGLVGTNSANSSWSSNAELTSVFLQPGEWKRFAGLPIRLESVKALQEIGVSLIRVGGSFAISDWYFWKYWRGPVWARPPARWGDSLITGFGPFEAMDLSSALGIDFVYTTSADCSPGNPNPDFGCRTTNATSNSTNPATPEAMAELVEYCWGGANTTGGRQRINDGHPEPYALKYVELGNEQVNLNFVDQVRAMQAKANELGVGTKLHYIYPWGTLTNVATAAHERTVADAASALQLGSQLILDRHTNAGRGRLQSAVQFFAPVITDPLLNEDNQSRWNIANFETNTGNYMFQDALDEAADLFLWFGMNGTLAQRVSGRAKSFCMERSGYNEGGANEQGMIWSLPNMTFLQPAGYVHKMIADVFLPIGIPFTQTCNSAVAIDGVTSTVLLLNMSVASSEDSNNLVVRAVNMQLGGVNTTFRLPGSGWVAVNITSLEPPEPGQTQAVNTPGEPFRIQPRTRTLLLPLKTELRRDGGGFAGESGSSFFWMVPPNTVLVAVFEKSPTARLKTDEVQQLAPRAFKPVALGRTLPSGWLRSQLDAQQAGLCGRGWLSGGVGTHELHANESTWVHDGGISSPFEESWPYWANGAIPLAALMQDAPKLAELRLMVDHLLAATPSAVGRWSEYWSAARAATALSQWAEATDDARIVPALVLFSSQLLHQLLAHPLNVNGSRGEGSWAGARWVEHVAVFEWLLDQRQLTVSQVAQVKRVISLLARQGLDWDRWILSSAERPFTKWQAATIAVPPWWQLLSGYALLNSAHSEVCGPHAHCRTIPLPRGVVGSSACSRACSADASCAGWSVLKDTPKSGRHNKGDLCQLFELAGMAATAPFYLRDLNLDCGTKHQLQPSPPRPVGPPPPAPPPAPAPPPPAQPDGFAPFFPNNTQDAEAIANNVWLPAMSQMLTHGVNLAQAMNVWGVMYRHTNDSSWLTRGRTAWEKVWHLHGQPTGVFSGDEGISGTRPDRGTETCTVVEILNSAAEMFLTSGDVFYADLAERVAMNALPGAFMNGSMWSLNYFQQVNKLDAIDGSLLSQDPIYHPHTPIGCENQRCVYCFGMVFECCVSNHVQGWPKWAARQLATVAPTADERRAGVALIYFFDATTKALRLEDGNLVSLDVTTQYPFAPNISVMINASRGFPFSVRIPTWSRRSMIRINDGPEQLVVRNGSMVSVEIPAGNEIRVEIVLALLIRVERRAPYILSQNETWSSNAATIHRGPLLFAVPRDFVLDHSEPYDDGPDLLPVGHAHGQNNFLLGTGNWRLALRISNDDDPSPMELEYVDLDVPAPPKGQGIFSPFLVPGGIRAKAQQLPAGMWQAVGKGTYLHGRGAEYNCSNGTTSIKGYACQWSGLVPVSPVRGMDGVELVDVLLLPFGATDLRVAELPTTTAAARWDETQY